MSITGISNAAGATMADIATPSPRLSRDLACSRGTDFFSADDLLKARRRVVNDGKPGCCSEGRLYNRRYRQCGGARALPVTSPLLAPSTADI